MVVDATSTFTWLFWYFVATCAVDLSQGFISSRSRLSIGQRNKWFPYSCNRITKQATHFGGRNEICMISSIKIRIVGKEVGSGGSDGWLGDAYGMYETRLRGNLDVETIWHKNDPAFAAALANDESKGHFVVLLDPMGKTYTSENFAEKFYQWMDMGGSRLSFAIGGAEGLPPSLKALVYQDKSRANPKIATLSLSPMTLTHQFSRVFLLEQIYRASEIRKGKLILFSVVIRIHSNNVLSLVLF